MLRKLAIAIAILAGIFAGIFWILTIPKIVSRSELGPHTADLENGRILFHAGGCASCHAIPKQEDKSRLGGGLALVCSIARQGGSARRRSAGPSTSARHASSHCSTRTSRKVSKKLVTSSASVVSVCGRSRSRPLPSSVSYRRV